MSLDQHVGDGDLALEIGPLARMPGVFIAADIKPRPSIERIFADPGHVVGHQIVAEAVALVGGAPRRAALRLDGEADAIADAACEYLLVFAIGIKGQNCRAIGFLIPGGAERMAALPRLKR